MTAVSKTNDTTRIPSDLVTVADAPWQRGRGPDQPAQLVDAVAGSTSACWGASPRRPWSARVLRVVEAVVVWQQVRGDLGSARVLRGLRASPRRPWSARVLRVVEAVVVWQQVRGDLGSARVLRELRASPRRPWSARVLPWLRRPWFGSKSAATLGLPESCVSCEQVRGDLGQPESCTWLRRSWFGSKSAATLGLPESCVSCEQVRGDLGLPELARG